MAEKKIGNRTFKVGTILAIDAISLQTRLIKVLGPAFERLPEVIALASGKGGDPNSGNVMLLRALNEVIQNSTSQEVSSLIKDIVEQAMILRQSGVYEQVDLDLDFTGQLGDLMPVVAFVLKETFSDFFTGLAASGKRQSLAKA